MDEDRRRVIRVISQWERVIWTYNEDTDSAGSQTDVPLPFDKRAVAVSTGLVLLRSP